MFGPTRDHSHLYHELTPAHLLLLAVGIGCAVVGRAVVNLLRPGHQEDNKTIPENTQVALAKDASTVALVWAEKRTPTRPQVQVFVPHPT